MHPMLTIAIKAARRAGSIINRASLNLDKISIYQKGPGDYVTNVDREAEEAIIQTLRDAYPDHAFIGEETGSTGQSDYKWLIDPLDGTRNFIHGFPCYAISIALAHKGTITQAVIYDPNGNDLYTATKGAGAFLNDRRIRVSGRHALSESVLVVAGNVSHLKPDTGVHDLRRLIHTCGGYRRLGSTVLELANVAAGRVDGYAGKQRNAWDMAAGTLLIQEAGGLIGDLNGEQSWMKSGDIVAATPKVFAQMLHVLNYSEDEQPEQKKQ